MFLEVSVTRSYGVNPRPMPESDTPTFRVVAQVCAIGCERVVPSASQLVIQEGQRCMNDCSFPSSQTLRSASLYKELGDQTGEADEGSTECHAVMQQMPDFRDLKQHAGTCP